MTGIDVGIGLPTTVPDKDGTALAEWARRAEELGFASLGVLDRLVYDYFEPLVSLAAAVGSGDAETITGIEFAFHRVFNQASGRIKLAWFLLNAARYMPVLVYAADPHWGEAAVDNHIADLARSAHQNRRRPRRSTRRSEVDSGR